MIRKDKSGKFIESGNFFVKYQFCSGKKVTKNSLSKSKHNKLLQIQNHDPVKIMVDQEKNRNWWMFQDKFYLEDEGLSSEEIKVFALKKSN
jgi:hypothetical protein